jgi:hypothetical protein
MPVNSETRNGNGAESHQILNRALVPEQQTTLRVSESAVLRIPSDHEYSIVSTGDVLVPLRRSEIGVMYRAVRAGQQTIVLNPHVSQGDCVSCESPLFHHRPCSQLVRDHRPAGLPFIWGAVTINTQLIVA